MSLSNNYAASSETASDSILNKRVKESESRFGNISADFNPQTRRRERWSYLRQRLPVSIHPERPFQR
jgi:hypothetical protein